MSKVPPLNTLRVEDYDAEQRKWLPRLFIPLNAFLTAATSALNGRIEFGANIPSFDNLYVFAYSGAPQRSTWNISLQPKVLWVGQATENGTALALIPVWAFDASSASITIDFKKLDGSDLTLGANYQIFVRAVP